MIQRWQVLGIICISLLMGSIVMTWAQAGTQITKNVSSSKSNKIVIAIDAGHGGQDPGAIGPSGLQEKQVTLAIARKLEAKLRQDPLFHTVMTRRGDYFVSVLGRSDIARREKANLLISIHADADPKRYASGVSVWVLSNQRADSELGRWLEQHEKQSELLGGAGDILFNNAEDRYLTQALLDLQFGYSQRVGYDVAVQVLTQLSRVVTVHKPLPEHASLGVLRSPDIPSLLVETGFMTHPQEERWLMQNAYQTKIANAIYRGIKGYYLAHPLEKNVQSITPSQAPVIQHEQGMRIHVVKPGETLSGIASHYSTQIATLSTVNRLSTTAVRSGQRLRIPTSTTINAAASLTQKKHIVQSGDTLFKIALQYGVTVEALKQANHLPTDRAILGKALIIPPPY